MSIIGTVYEDVTTDVLGKIGRWQWFVTIMSSAMIMPVLFNRYEDSFMMQPVNVVCVPPQRVVIRNISLCSVTIEANETDVVRCSKWHVKLMWLIWLKKSWILFCDQNSKLQSAAIISRCGVIFGCIIFGLLSDSCGRKTAITIDLFVTLILEVIVTFCDAEGWFRLFLFLKALFGSANMFMGFLLVCEIASNSWRSTLILVAAAPRLVAMVCAVPFSNATLNMETHGFIAALLYVVCIIVLRKYPESPQWLLYNRKIQVAEMVLKNAAKINGITLHRDFMIRPVDYRAYNCLDEATTCVGVLSTHNIRTLYIVTTIYWSIFHFLWSSLYVRAYNENIEDISWKVCIVVALFGCLTITASRKATLRHLLLFHAIITGVFTTFLVFIEKGILQRLAASIALSAGIIAHALILMITPRLFAINIRASALGGCHATGQLGSTISYIFHLFQPLSDVTFFIVITVATVTLAGLCLVMPNVEGRELPDVMEDMDYYSELSKPLRWVSQKTSSPSMEEREIRIHSFGSRGADSTTSHSSKPETRRQAQRVGMRSICRTMAEYLRSKIQR